MTAAPRVAIIIINYKGREDTLECLQSLTQLTYSPYEIILVDQDSKDGTPDVVRASFPSVHVIANPINNGFAGGNNVGLRVAMERSAEYLFLLNNDTVVEPGLLEPLVSLAGSDPQIGVVGPAMLYHAQPDTIWSAGGTIDWQGNSNRPGVDTVYMPGGTPQDVDFIVGCGLLVKRSVLEQVGLFDERYFLYFEETDLCARIREAGYRVVYQPAARLWHKVSRSTGADSELTLYYMRRNALLYLRLHGMRGAMGVLAGLYSALRLAAVWTVQGKRRRRTVLLCAIGDFLRGRFGKANFFFQ